MSKLKFSLISEQFGCIVTPLITGLTVAAAAMGGRYMVHAWNNFKSYDRTPDAPLLSWRVCAPDDPSRGCFNPWY
ncbi:mitochondrial import inner membrane translocase subunit TIM14-3-like protein [Carex littledalei]|uniref:Mitochondrial import inner membrane translocase subunit TIM14-3-like protein n=1 Tax=Carex littledalei TaxID=544730 RepID=A0A833RIX7_9POAL|nr:mitochondrial import inner membrane translocase subunit TIM14-3-like protein [Carex littledalei]